METPASPENIKASITYSKNPGYNPDMIVGGAEHRIQAMHPETGEVMGQMTWWGHDGPVAGEIDKIDVGEKFRRQGIASQMLEEARRTSEIDKNVPYAVHSTTRTAEGEAWAQSTGDKLPPRNSGSLELGNVSVATSPKAPILVPESIFEGDKILDSAKAISAKVKSGEVLLEDLSHQEYRQWENSLADQVNEHENYLAAEHEESLRRMRADEILDKEYHPGEALNAKIKSGELNLEDLSHKEYSQWESLLADQANEHGGFSTMHGPKAIIDSSPLPQAAEEMLSISPTAEKVITKTATPFRSMLDKANARGMSALEQSMDLVADISHGAKSSATAGVIEDLIPKVTAPFKTYASGTADLIIDGMKLAQKNVGKLGKTGQIGLAVGSLAAIGAVSNRSLKKRRG